MLHFKKIRTTVVPLFEKVRRKPIQSFAGAFTAILFIAIYWKNINNYTGAIAEIEVEKGTIKFGNYEGAIAEIQVEKGAIEIQVEKRITRTNYTIRTNYPGAIAEIQLEKGEIQLEKGTVEIQAGTSKKPTLILHVGPLKSGTTFIQMNLLGNRKVQKKLLRDNVKSVEFGYMQFGQLEAQCLSRVNENQEKCEDDTRWKDLLRLLEDAYHPGATVIHSVETYSGIPDNKFTINLLRSLQEKWNIKVLLFHRRPSGWFPSMYYQRRKGMMYRSRSDTYHAYPKTNTESMLTFPKFMEGQLLHNRDSWSTAEIFQRIFGEANVRILNFHSSHSLGVEFLCEGVEAPRACAWARTNTVPGVNVNTFLLFDEDLLVMEAHRQGLFQPAKHFVNRHEATLRIKPYLDDVKSDLPMVCLSQDQNEWLWNRTLWAEQNMLVHAPNQSSSIETLREDFQKNANKFCHLDAVALLQNETWRNLLSVALSHSYNATKQ
jgi:hypothetical protein